MDIRLENKNTFFVSGYPMESKEETLEKDCATLRANYEEKLRAISNHLYFASWVTKDEVMTYLLGVEVENKNPATEDAICIEIPATRFAVATVPKGAPILSTWHEFFEKGIPSVNAAIDTNYSFYFESFDENGDCELWIPVE